MTSRYVCIKYWCKHDVHQPRHVLGRNSQSDILGILEFIHLSVFHPPAFPLACIGWTSASPEFAQVTSFVNGPSKVWFWGKSFIYLWPLFGLLCLDNRFVANSCNYKSASFILDTNSVMPLSWGTDSTGATTNLSFTFYQAILPPRSVCCAQLSQFYHRIIPAVLLIPWRPIYRHNCYVIFVGF